MTGFLGANLIALNLVWEVMIFNCTEHRQQQQQQALLPLVPSSLMHAKLVERSWP